MSVMTHIKGLGTDELLLIGVFHVFDCFKNQSLDSDDSRD